MSLDHLGPVVVTEDGSLRRINNWGEMTERERAVTLRRITKRNRERLAKLRASSATEDGDGSSTSASKASGAGAGATAP